MVNTVKLLLISQQSGLEVAEQEGLRTPFGNMAPPLDAQVPLRAGTVSLAAGHFPKEILLCGTAGSSVSSQPLLGGYQGGET